MQVFCGDVPLGRASIIFFLGINFFLSASCKISLKLMELMGCSLCFLGRFDNKKQERKSTRLVSIWYYWQIYKSTGKNKTRLPPWTCLTNSTIAIAGPPGIFYLSRATSISLKKISSLTLWLYIILISSFSRSNSALFSCKNPLTISQSHPLICWETSCRSTCTCNVVRHGYLYENKCDNCCGSSN